MFGPSGKSGRGGRGGGSSGAKRKLQSNFHSASLNRPSGRRPSAGAAAGGSSASRNSRKTTTTPPSPSAAAPSAAVEESFSLVTGNPLDFAMIIRLTPDLVDEIKRVEAQGGSARIKFDANAKNTSGNVSIKFLNFAVLNAFYSKLFCCTSKIGTKLLLVIQCQ